MSLLTFNIPATNLPTQIQDHSSRHVLKSNCKVSEISSDLFLKSKIYSFKITWPADDENSRAGKRKEDGKDKDASAPPVEKKASTSSSDGSKVAALAVGGVVIGALTSGIGLIAGMMVVGLGAAAGGSAAMSGGSAEKDKTLVLACEKLDEAESWVETISTVIKEIGSSGSQSTRIPTHISQASRSHAPPPGIRLEEVEEWIKSPNWKVSCIEHGHRLLEFTSVSSGSKEREPCFKVNIGMSGSTTDIFMAIMNMPPLCRTGIINNIRVVDTIDNYTDVVHINLEPVYLSPTWTSQRDLCLIRYWRHNSDGSYVICLDSTTHEDCPLVAGIVRAQMHGAYVIIPPKEGHVDEDHVECLVTFAAQLSPRGWIWKKYGYSESFLKNFMLHVVDIRDAIDASRFVNVQFDMTSLNDSSVKGDTGEEEYSGDSEGQSLGTRPPPYLQPSMWRESDSLGFKLRGKTYCQDKVKATSAKQLFKLIAIDLFEVPETTPNICGHPRNRVFQAMQRGDDTWIFAVNIMVPGPPYLSFVAYFKGDRALIEADTPFGRIARPFFNGSDDEFRNNRFKLIPRVLDGNMIIKMAVKDTPTLIGNKLKQVLTATNQVVIIILGILDKRL